MSTEADAACVLLQGAHPGGVTAVAWLSETSLLSAGDDACLRKWTVAKD